MLARARGGRKSTRNPAPRLGQVAPGNDFMCIVPVGEPCADDNRTGRAIAGEQAELLCAGSSGCREGDYPSLLTA